MPPPKSPRLAYLRLRGLSYELHYPIPADLRRHYLTSKGKPRTHIDKALGTRDPDEAYRRKLVELQRIEAEYRALRRTDKGATPADIEEAKGLRKDIEEASNADNFDLASTLGDLLTDKAERIHHEGGRTAASLKRARTFVRIAQGEETLRESFEAWMKAGTLPDRTQSKYRTALEEFATHVGGEPLLSDMNEDTALSYVDWLNKEARSQRTKKLVPLSFNTKRDRVMALSAFWNTWLRPRRKVKGEHPFKGLQITDRPTDTDIAWDSTENTGRPKRRPYFDENDLLSILDAKGPRIGGQTRYPKSTLMEVLCLGLLTGARPDEVCSLKLEEVRTVEGGYLFRDDEAFRFQLIRKVRGLDKLAVYESWNHQRRATRRVYRDMPPRAVRMLAEQLGVVFGDAGLLLRDHPKARPKPNAAEREEREAIERQELAAALEDF